MRTIVRNKFSAYQFNLVRELFPVVFVADEPHSIAGNFVSPHCRAHDGGNLFCERLRISRWKQDRVLAIGKYFVDSRAGGDHCESTARHGFEHDKSPSLFVVGEKKCVAGGVEILDLFIGYFAGESDFVLDSTVARQDFQRAQIFGITAVGTGEKKFDSHTA